MGDQVTPAIKQVITAATHHQVVKGHMLQHDAELIMADVECGRTAEVTVKIENGCIVHSSITITYE